MSNITSVSDWLLEKEFSPFKVILFVLTRVGSPFILSSVSPELIYLCSAEAISLSGEALF